MRLSLLLFIFLFTMPLSAQEIGDWWGSFNYRNAEKLELNSRQFVEENVLERNYIDVGLDIGRVYRKNFGMGLSLRWVSGSLTLPTSTRPSVYYYSGKMLDWHLYSRWYLAHQRKFEWFVETGFSGVSNFLSEQDKVPDNNINPVQFMLRYSTNMTLGWQISPNIVLHGRTEAHWKVLTKFKSPRRRRDYAIGRGGLFLDAEYYFNHTHLKPTAFPKLFSGNKKRYAELDARIWTGEWLGPNFHVALGAQYPSQITTKYWINIAVFDWNFPSVGINDIGVQLTKYETIKSAANLYWIYGLSFGFVEDEAHTVDPMARLHLQGEYWRSNRLRINLGVGTEHTYDNLFFGDFRTRFAINIEGYTEYYLTPTFSLVTQFKMPIRQSYHGDILRTRSLFYFYKYGNSLDVAVRVYW